MDPDGDAVPYGEFVALARDEGVIAIEVQVVQAPSESNGRTAVVQATARTSGNGAFSAVGEASPRSAPETWHPFLTTLAELRAKARALRDVTGLDHPVHEELAVPYTPAPGNDDDGVSGRALPERRQVASPAAPAYSAVARPAQPPVAEPPSAALRDAQAFLQRAERKRAQVEDEDKSEALGDDDSGDSARGAEEDEEMPSRPAVAANTARSTATEPSPDDVPPDFDAIPPDMMDKLIRLATSIAKTEGAEISDAEARQKLDDFFMRAFRHPLARATRIEGQRVVQRLSGDLARRRMATPEED